jgi:hypothetical protein
MKKLLTMCALLCVAALPATASAADPTPAQFKNAAKFCKEFKKASGANFATMFGTKKNAYGKCVSQTAKAKAKKDAQQAAAAQTNAAKTCKAERGTTNESRAAFKAKYGEKGNGIGKCVSQEAKKNRAEAEKQEKAEDQNRVSAAKQCKTERGTTTESKNAFAAKYGTNKNKRNAFGKCVSKTAKAMNEQEQTTQS